MQFNQSLLVIMHEEYDDMSINLIVGGILILNVTKYTLKFLASYVII